MEVIAALKLLVNLYPGLVDDIHSIVNKYNNNDVKAAFAILGISLRQCKPTEEETYNFNRVQEKLTSMDERLTAYTNVLAALKNPIDYDSGLFTFVSIADFLLASNKITEEELQSFLKHIETGGTR